MHDALTNVLEDGDKVVTTRTIASLWDDYGSVEEIQTARGRRLIAKLVDVARAGSSSGGASISHRRKLTSYRVEAYFYDRLAGRLSDPANVARCWSSRGQALVLDDLRQAYPVQASTLSLQQTRTALCWLAAFHAAFWEVDIADVVPACTTQSKSQDTAGGVWEQDSYWYLDTRQDEYRRIGRSQCKVKNVAHAVDAHLKAYLTLSDTATPSQYRTLLHGDPKGDNIMFNADASACAMYDFQYTGYGYGVRDVAYLLASSADERVVAQHEDELLQVYYGELTARGCNYPWATMQWHYQLCLVDYMRFMAGWGMWGNKMSNYFDVHCHLTDTPGTLEHVAAVETAKLAFMGTRFDDLDLVADSAAASSAYRDKVVPGFGIHPWFAHQTQQRADWLSQLRQLLDRFPHSFVGEIGFDKVARHPGSSEKYDYQEQMQVFEAQFALAAQLDKVVSVHCVQAHGDLLHFLRSLSARKSEGVLPKRIMLHSYSGSVDVLQQLLKLPRVGERVYCSYSTAVNARSPRLVDRIRATPDTRVLLESDTHDAREVDVRMQAIAQCVGDAKGWTVQQTREQCWHNAQVFFSV
ncbi:Cut9-interacting protein scn1 [Sorochytrium milnesiophthora]